MKRFALLLGLLLAAAMCALSAERAAAHANLVHADPPAGAALNTAPMEIRLVFTEPPEPALSRVTLLDAQGSPLDTPPAVVDPADPMTLLLRPGALDDGIYTVVWRVVSAADSHATEGSYAFSIGANWVEDAAALETAPETLDTGGAAVRLVNLLGITLLVGSIGFGRLVWAAALSRGGRRLRRLIWAGWALTGGGLAAALLYGQLAVAGGSVSPLTLLTETAFGRLWLGRAALWALLGAALLPPIERRAGWLAPLLAIPLPFAYALAGHAGGAAEPLAAAVGSGVHLLTTSLWLGGLVALAAVITPAREAGVLGEITARFSNLARLCVAALFVTGLYAAWLHVGSVDALATTAYGQALLVKLALLVPLLMLGGVNLLLTTRALRRGNTPWAGRLRVLVGLESALALGVLAAVGALTSLNPAREVVALREAGAAVPERGSISAMEMAPDLHIHLDIVPGQPGDNRFTLRLYDAVSGDRLSDASRIRLRFESLDQNTGRSELRAEPQADGSYRVDGANLSFPGRWRIRVTVQRPGEFDTVLDFTPTVSEAPAPPLIESEAPPSERLIALGLMAAGLAALGLLALAQRRRTPALLMDAGG